MGDSRRETRRLIAEIDRAERRQNRRLSWPQVAVITAVWLLVIALILWLTGCQHFHLVTIEVNPASRATVTTSRPAPTTFLELLVEEAKQ